VGAAPEKPGPAPNGQSASSRRRWSVERRVKNAVVRLRRRECSIAARDIRAHRHKVGGVQGWYTEAPPAGLDSAKVLRDLGGLKTMLDDMKAADRAARKGGTDERSIEASDLPFDMRAQLRPQPPGIRDTLAGFLGTWLRRDARLGFTAWLGGVRHRGVSIHTS
jgi:hypothetical protein